MTLIFAHRGSAGTHPENTMEAFRVAEDCGADGIELDVHLTADGEIVVIHDETLDRTTNGTGYVKNFTLEQLKYYKANYHFKHFYKQSSTIPSLREVFDWMRKNNLVCNVELKNNHIKYELLEEKVISLIREFNYANRTIISSFNHYSLLDVNRLAPEIEIAPLYNDLKLKPWEYAKAIKATGIHPKWSAINPVILKETLANGIAVRPYTINRERDMKSFIEQNCTAIITDYPEKALKIKRKIK